MIITWVIFISSIFCNRVPRPHGRKSDHIVPCFTKRLQDLEHIKKSKKSGGLFVTDLEPAECQRENPILYEPKSWTYDDFCYCLDPITGWVTDSSPCVADLPCPGEAGNTCDVYPHRYQDKIRQDRTAYVNGMVDPVACNPMYPELYNNNKIIVHERCYCLNEYTGYIDQLIGEISCTD